MGDIIQTAFFQSDDEAATIDQSELMLENGGAGDVKYEDLDGDGKITKGGGNNLITRVIRAS